MNIKKILATIPHWLGVTLLVTFLSACGTRSVSSPTPVPPAPTLPPTQVVVAPPPAPTNTLAQPPQPTAPPPATPPQAKRIQFEPGGTSATVKGSIAPNAMERYVLRALAGQTMNVNATTSQGQVVLSVFGADGTVLITDHAGAMKWSGTLPSSQDYNIDVRSVGNAIADYSLEVVIPPRSAQTYDDPFAYCAAVGNIDTPDARVLGPKVPELITKAMQKIAPNAPLDQLSKAVYWRCMNGKVYGCFVGANIPCWTKADTSRTPRPEMNDFCKTQPNAESIPAFAAGRETIYEWRCKNGTAEVAKQVFTLDARGYVTDFWYELSPN